MNAPSRITEVLLAAILVMIGSVAYRARSTITRILDDVDRVVVRLEALEQKLDRSVPADEMDSILDELATWQEDAEQQAIAFNPNAEAEVKFLLRRLATRKISAAWNEPSGARPVSPPLSVPPSLPAQCGIPGS